jgi:hypothetical protein
MWAAKTTQYEEDQLLCLLRFQSISRNVDFHIFMELYDLEGRSVKVVFFSKYIFSEIKVLLTQFFLV